MKFSILVMAAPHSAEGGDSAWQFARAVLDAGHELVRVFFYQDGIYHGNQLAVAAQDDIDRVERWADIANQHNVDLVLCIASAARRGVIDAGEADRHEKPASNAHPAFELSGLGQLVDAHIDCDRLVTFGAAQ